MSDNRRAGDPLAQLGGFDRPERVSPPTPRPTVASAIAREETLGAHLGEHGDDSPVARANDPWRNVKRDRSPAPYAESTDRAQLDSLSFDSDKASENLYNARPENRSPVYVGSLAREIADASEWATVSVGRNIGNDGTDRLGSDEWARFRLAIDDLFDPIGGDFRVVGISYSAEHGQEDTYVVGGTLHLSRVPVRTVLARLARRYGQTAIALVYGGERVSAECEHESITTNGNSVCDACGQVNP